MMNARITKITVSALAMLGAVAVPSAAWAASTTTTTSHVVTVPKEWVDTAVSFPDQQQCTAYGEQANASGYANGFSCVQLKNGRWELWVDEA
jgi:hypothetical protein